MATPHDDRDDDPRPVREWIRTVQFAGSVALALFVVGLLSAAVLLGAPTSTEGTTEPPVIDVSAPREAPAVPATVLTPGVYQAGVDMVPGRWRTPGPRPEAEVRVCSWERATSNSGAPADIMASATVRGAASLHADDGDWVTVAGPCTWRPAG